MAELVNKNATKEARALYDFICENFGSRIISAAQECPGHRHHDLEMNWLYENVGKLPAMRGLDFIHDDYFGVVRRAREWNARGGIVTICWHTGVVGNTYPDSKEELPDFDRLFESGTEENRLLMSRWERARDALGELKDAGIPVLWRPFHEFDGPCTNLTGPGSGGERAAARSLKSSGEKCMRPSPLSISSTT